MGSCIKVQIVMTTKTAKVICIGEIVEGIESREGGKGRLGGRGSVKGGVDVEGDEPGERGVTVEVARERQ